MFATALAVLLVPPQAAAQSHAEALKAGFEAAKACLAAGDLAQAEARYKQTIALGLRQLATLSLSESQLEPATRDLDEAVKLQPRDPNLRLDAAAVWFRRGDVKKARELAQGLLADDLRSALAYALLGRIELFRGDFAAAAEALQSSVQLNFDFETAYFLGLALLKEKKVAAVQDLFGELQSRMGDSAALHALFGRAYLIAHVPETALAEFREAVRLDPKYPRAHGLLGYAYLESFGEEAYARTRGVRKGARDPPGRLLFAHSARHLHGTLRDFTAGEAALLHASRVRPEEPFPYLYLGEIYSQTNRTRQAVDVVQKFIRLIHAEDAVLRDLSRAYYLLGRSLLRLGRSEEGRQALARSQQYREAKFRYDSKHIFDQEQPSDDGRSRPSDRVAGLLDAAAPEQTQATQAMLQEGVSAPSSVAASTPPPVETASARQYRAFAAEILASSYNHLGVMRAKDSKFGEAAEFFKQAAIWKPDLSGLDRNWGLASFRAQRYAEAISPLERQLASHPDDAFVRQLLGLSHFFTDNFAKASEVLQPFAAKPPSDPGLLYAWGVSLVRTKQSADAARIFRILLEQNAANPEVRFLLGQAYAQQEDYPDALNELKAALQLNPRLPEVHYYSGLVLLHQGNFDAAAQEFLAELELRPGDPVTTYHLGFTLLSQGKAPEAAALFRQALKARPDYELAHFELGRALLQTGDDTGAIESLETAKKLAPDRDATWYQLSQAYRRAGRQQEAQQALVTYQKLIEESRLKKRKFLEADQP